MIIICGGLLIFGGCGTVAAYSHQTQSGRTALIFAAQNGHAECVRLLLEVGADKDAVDNVRGVILMGVCMCAHVSMYAFMCLLSDA